MREGEPVSIASHQEESANPILDAAQLASAELKAFRDRLSSDTRHSFRTPLTVIDGNARRLERNVDNMTPDEIRHRVHTIRGTVEKMVELVEQSIQMSELTSCVQDFPPKRSDLIVTINNMVKEHRAGAPDYNLVAMTDSCEGLCVADERLLELVLDKMFALGAEIIDKRGRVDFVSWSDGQTVSLSLKAIFEANANIDVQRIEDRIRDHDRLTLLCKGMEIRIIRLLIEQHGGELDTEIQRDFVEFEIHLPIGTDNPPDRKSLIINQSQIGQG